jgi:hypothetical protein
VSDVTPSDFGETIAFLLDPAFFPRSPDAGLGPDFEHLKHMVSRWKGYVEQSIFNLSVPVETPLGGGVAEATRKADFWTGPWPYWNIESLAPEVFQILKSSNLVIFKVSPRGPSTFIIIDNRFSKQPGRSKVSLRAISM